VSGELHTVHRRARHFVIHLYDTFQQDHRERAYILHAKFQAHRGSDLITRISTDTQLFKTGVRTFSSSTARSSCAPSFLVSS
jgi:hypothetical protein